MNKEVLRQTALASMKAAAIGAVAETDPWFANTIAAGRWLLPQWAVLEGGERTLLVKIRIVEPRVVEKMEAEHQHSFDALAEALLQLNHGGSVLVTVVAPAPDAGAVVHDVETTIELSEGVTADIIEALQEGELGATP